jgi:hypothetical protein
MSAISNWRKGPTKPIKLKMSQCHQTDVDDAIEEQSQIGWGNLLQGYVSIKWGYASLMSRTILKLLEGGDMLRNQNLCKARQFNTNKTITALYDYTLAPHNDILHNGDEHATATIMHVVCINLEISNCTSIKSSSTCLIEPASPSQSSAFYEGTLLERMMTLMVIAIANSLLILSPLMFATLSTSVYKLHYT